MEKEGRLPKKSDEEDEDTPVVNDEDLDAE